MIKLQQQYTLYHSNTRQTQLYWGLLRLILYKHCCRYLSGAVYISNVIVSYFSVFEIAWCFILPDYDNAITEICRRDSNCTVVLRVLAYVGFINKTRIRYD
jgi:hypothetical protein